MIYEIKRFLLKTTKLKLVLLIAFIGLVIFESYLIVARLKVINEVKSYYNETTNDLDGPKRSLRSVDLYQALSNCDFINSVGYITEFDSTSGTLNVVRDLNLSDLNSNIENLVEVNLEVASIDETLKYLKAHNIQCEYIECVNNTITFRVSLSDK